MFELTNKLSWCYFQLIQALSVKGSNSGHHLVLLLVLFPIHISSSSSQNLGDNHFHKHFFTLFLPQISDRHIFQILFFTLYSQYCCTYLASVLESLNILSDRNKLKHFRAFTIQNASLPPTTNDIYFFQVYIAIYYLSKMFFWWI